VAKRIIPEWRIRRHIIDTFIFPDGYKWLHEHVKFPKHVYVVGSGPKGFHRYNSIPHNAMKLGVNGAVMYKTLDYVFYGATDVYEQNWWKNKHKYDTKTVFRPRVTQEKEDRADYYFDVHNIYKGTSIGNLVVYLVYYCKVKHITFCGVDMHSFDNFYEKGVRTEDMGVPRRKIQRMIDALPCKFDSISKTLLDIPHA
jgi:hypothetical protein